ncbi:MAG: hydrogenase nickel incorporation protein HypB, partial [Thermoproteota archaeon]|nr:hydrogenase nickel incorporation protein HypB [Thermoproteota archaeon]
MVRVVKAEIGETFDVELSEDLLKANEKIALENRDNLRKHGVKAIDIMGSVGSGKTSLMEQLVRNLKVKYRILAIAGDLGTTIDSSIIAKHGVEVLQINTGRECHLDANLVRKALNKINLDEISLLLIENVGNLICPSEFPLGSEKRVVVISLTEGPYMVLKHPLTFMSADVVVINKMDLQEVLGADANKLEMDVHNVNPKAKVIKVSCKTGSGI